MPINSPTGFLDITNATLRTSNVEAQNLLITGGNIYVTSELEADATVLNLENVTRKGNVSSNTIEITNATTGIVATGNVHALKFIGSGSHLTGIPPTAITGTLSQWSDGANSDVYIASNVGIGNVHTLTSNTLQVGGNLYVRDTDANVLTVNGNVVASYFEGDGSRLSGIVTDLQGVTDNGNVTTNVVQFSNATTGLVTTANIEVGGDIKVVGLSAGTVPYVASDKFLKDSFITMTGDATVITSNLDVTGNIFMRGEKFIVESETKLINDAIIGIANNNTVSTTDKGIIMQNTTGNVAIIHHGTGDGFADQLTFGYTADPLDTVTVTNDLTKELTVNVLGNVITQNNLSIGGLLKINTISAASSHSLQAVTNLGNVTSNTVQFSNAITSLVASSNIVATGNVSAGRDTDTTSYFGRAAVGYMGTSDQASFAHFDRNSSAQYALKQTAAGPTYINTPASGHIRFTVNDGNAGAEKMRITSAGNVGIGVSAPHANLHVEGNVYVSSNLTVNGNVSDLNVVSNVNMLHTSNTAAIKLNSNVVAEFSRSKKLIKYPRVVIASGQSGLSGGYTQDGYTVQASSEWGGTHMTSNVFNGIKSYQTGSPPDYAWLSGGDPDTYTLTTGLATTVDQFQDENGSWVGLALPDKIKLSSVHLYNRRDQSNSVRPARKGIVWGSDGGSTWYRIKDFTNGSMDGALNVISVDSNVLYDHFRVQITEMHNSPQKDAVAIGELEFYGVPEYDSDAHGTDVIIKSKANVPNTDWLEVYYDGQDYTSVVTTIDNKTGVSAQDATITNSGDITFDSTYRAWNFGGDDTRTDTFITTLPSTFQGNQVHSVSTWFKYDVHGDDAIFSISPSSGEGTDNKSIGVRLNINQTYHLRYYHWGNDILVKFPSTHPMLPDTWYNLVVTYNGIVNSEYRGKAVYINGEFCPVVSSTGLSAVATLNLDGGDRLQLGRRNYSNGDRFFGSIANFRLFNRVLTSDEIYQLYAYQKSFFGHGDLSMTLKAGRLGIGTSEPRAALDVRGDVLINGYQLTSMYPGFASGGDDVYDFDGYRVHAFTSSGTLHIPSGDLKVDILLVGGGGGGGQDNAGGGGAGGLVIRPGLRLQTSPYAITVGSGGIGSKDQDSGPAPTGGGDTKIETYPLATTPLQTQSGSYNSNYGTPTLIAKGGGPGNSGGGAPASTRNGGSGGGQSGEGATNGTAGGTATQYGQSGDSGTYGFGNNGGASASDGGGGGGGAGAVGQNGNILFSGSGGNGGDGKCSALFNGSEANFADMFGTRYGEIIDEEAWFAGGGGGGNRNAIYTGYAVGGKGGGGNAGNTNTTNEDGLPNTGGGGAGAMWDTTANGGGNLLYNLHGGHGGSGIVLLRYKL